MSSDSDLTDVSDGYELENGSNKRRRGGPSDYKITNALQTPNTSSYATVWLATLMRDGDIKLNPEYQRDVVWSDSKQTKLIDSILRNYYIPPVIFSLSTDKSGNQTRVCIDGKQRLTSISRFIDGMIPHRDGGASYYFKQADPSKNVRLLPENLRKQFRNKQVICIEYRELSPAAERDIFQRVQLGMALTTGEQFQSYDGPLAKFIHRMHTKLFDEGQVDKLIALAADRGKGFQNLVRTVACISRLPNYTHPSQVQQAKLLQCQGFSEEQVTALQRKSERAFGILQEIANDTTLREIAFPLPNRTTKTSPVEFCFATLLIAMHMDEPDTKARQMAEQIRQMNTEMRAMYSDMRSNNKVSLSFWEYLSNPQKRASQVAAPELSVPVPVPAPASAASSTPVPAPSQSPKAKRIRVHPPATPGKSWQASLTQPSTTPGKSPGKRKVAATPRSDSAAQFHNIFGSSRQEPQQPSQPETSDEMAS